LYRKWLFVFNINWFGVKQKLYYKLILLAEGDKETRSIWTKENQESQGDFAEQGNKVIMFININCFGAKLILN
jgi:hypothetical protein